MFFVQDISYLHVGLFENILTQVWSTMCLLWGTLTWGVCQKGNPIKIKPNPEKPLQAHPHIPSRTVLPSSVSSPEFSKTYERRQQIVSNGVQMLLFLRDYSFFSCMIERTWENDVRRAPSVSSLSV